MPRMVDLNITTYWWVDEAAITDPDAIKIGRASCRERV